MTISLEDHGLPRPSRVALFLLAPILACSVALPVWSIATSPTDTSIFSLAMVTALAALMLWSAFAAMGYLTVRFSSTSVTRLTLTWRGVPCVRKQSIQWIHVEDILVNDILITIRSKDEAIVLNIAAFSRYREVEGFIRDRISGSRAA